MRCPRSGIDEDVGTITKSEKGVKREKWDDRSSNV